MSHLSTSRSLLKNAARFYVCGRRFARQNRNRRPVTDAIEVAAQRPLGQPTAFTHPHLMSANEVTPGISRQEYAERRQRLFEAAVAADDKASTDGRTLVLLCGSPVTYSAPDVPHTFRQDANFLYMCGLREPDSLLAIHASGGGAAARSTLFVRQHDPQRELWEGATAGVNGALALTAVDDALPHSDFERFLADFCGGAPTRFWFDPTALPERVQRVVLTALQESGSLLTAAGSPLSLVHRLRWVKSDAELALLRRCAHIGAAALSSTMAFTRAGMDEGQLVAKFDLEARLRGASGLAYPPVVAGGNRANTIHYLNADQLLAADEMVLMDAGCELHGVVCDITRSWPVSGRFSAGQRVLYDALFETQTALLRFVDERRPLVLRDVYAQQVSLLGAQLQRAGVLSTQLTDGQLKAQVETLCPHHVSHYLGMDVHDTATVKRDLPLPPNVVITVEPGIYMREDDESVAPEFRGIGMRIEDDIIVHATTSEVLTESCIKSPEDIEQVFADRLQH